jgi:hypothetical protein
MKVKRGLLILIWLLFLSSGIAWSEDNGLLSLTNKYVKIFINNTAEETGRFAIDTTAGDSTRSDDDDKPLIYGHPKPWTSYTTLRIADQNYVFGKATKTRPGKKLPGGEIIAPPQLVDNQITMKCKYGSIIVEQILDLTHSPSTGALDTARIKYVIQNSGTAPTEVGLRTTFDTLVGANDGAPFRFGEHEITAETGFDRQEFPDFWQAFDSLDQPSVIAQGTLKGGDVTSPDRMAFVNWGKAADYPWDLPLESGANFIRSGEDELDSAVVMWWSPRVVEPGGSQTIIIYYGLGGVTFSPGNTYLGIAAPADVQYLGADTRNYTIVMYLEHRGEAKATDVTINLDLPPGLSLVAGEPQLKLAELLPGVTKQFSWEIKPDGLYSGDSSFQIRVAGEGLEPNQVTRKIKILGPITLGATMTLPKLKVVANQWEPKPFPIKLTLRNLDNLTARALKAVFVGAGGLRLAAGERAEKLLVDIDPAKTAKVEWQVNPELQFETGAFKIAISGANTLPLEVPGEVTIPTLATSLDFSGPGPLKVGEVFYLDLNAYNIYKAQKFTLTVTYDPTQLRLVYISRGTFLVGVEGQLANWSSGTIKLREGKAVGISGKRSFLFKGTQTTLARLNFVALRAGVGEIGIEHLILQDAKGNKLPYEFTPLKYQILEEKK